MESSSEFDFIIVGGGTAGLVIATRLSEDPNVQVLVLEAGNDHTEDLRVKVPLLYDSLARSELDWAFKTVPQESLHGREILLTQGRALGGSSAINATVLMPPSSTIIDAWGRLGDGSWTWEILKPYFSRLFTLETPSAGIRDKTHLDWIDDAIASAPGPVQATFIGSYDDPIPQAFVDSIHDSFPVKEDIFSGKLLGAFRSFGSVDPHSKERGSATTAYYAPARNRTNLHVFTGCITEKIILENDGHPDLLASGVIYSQGGETKTAKARKEVILTAGAIGTPKLLELSGIGSPDLLQSLGIPVHIANKAVGENLQDHIVTAIGFEVQDHVQTVDDLVRQDPAAIQAGMGQYMMSKSGPFTSCGLASSAYLPLQAVADQDQAKLDHLLNSDDAAQGNGLQRTILRSIIQDRQEASGAYLTVPAQAPPFWDAEIPTPTPQAIPGKFMSFAIYLPHPFSRGSSHIRSTDFQDAPSLDPNYLSDPIDMEVFAGHIKYLETIVQSTEMSTLLVPNGKRSDPRASFETLDRAKEYARSISKSMWHPCGTCAMLPQSEGGVVNENLVVFGSRNLRIADASIFPLIPRGNLQATVYVVAERAADLIKAKYAAP